jgi:hypothetical protein
MYVILSGKLVILVGVGGLPRIFQTGLNYFLYPSQFTIYNNHHVSVNTNKYGWKNMVICSHEVS